MPQRGNLNKRLAHIIRLRHLWQLCHKTSSRGIGKPLHVEAWWRERQK